MNARHEGDDAATGRSRRFAGSPPPDGQPWVQNLATYVVPSGYRGRSKLYVQLWWTVQATLFAWSPQVAYRWRAFLLRLFGCKVGAGTIIRPSVRITYPWKVSIGDLCQIGDDVEIYSLGEIRIGSNAVVSQRSYICAGTHDYTKASFDLLPQTVTIEDEAWICTDVFVHPGVTVGRGAVIAARSTLGTDAVPYGVYAGMPAKWLRDRRSLNEEWKSAL